MNRHAGCSFQMVALGLVLAVSGCSLAYGQAELDDEVLELVDVRATVTTATDTNAHLYKLTAWDNPSCLMIDDEVAVQLELRVVDIGAVPLDTEIDVSQPDLPVAVSLAMGAMGSYCMETDCVDPSFSLAGTLTLTELSESEVRGSADITLTGDVPQGGDAQRIFKPDAVLHLSLPSFRMPDSVEHCL
ncbi:MAG: hypothetical protein JXR83_07785 [Deltaproteobacteria bacterium]|nr:hypothetical protein [Deltaproteobacteria bacterium]